MIFEQQMDLLKKENKPEWTRPNFPDTTNIEQVANLFLGIQSILILVL